MARQPGTEGRGWIWAERAQKDLEHESIVPECCQGLHELTCVCLRLGCSEDGLSRVEELVGRGSDKLFCGGRWSLVAANAGLRGEPGGYWESP